MQALWEEVAALEPDDFSPKDALNYLYELKKKVDAHE